LLHLYQITVTRRLLLLSTTPHADTARSVGAVEAAHTIHNGWKLSLSEQLLLDYELRDEGCKGGHVEMTLQWIIDNGGIIGKNASGTDMGSLPPIVFCSPG
jgi:hypothetical protein